MDGVGVGGHLHGGGRSLQLRKTGSLAVGATCLFNSQCGAGVYCLSNPAKPACSVCTAALSAGSMCTVDSDCDVDNGYRCAATFVSGVPPTSDGNPICQQVTYGSSGASCVPGTNMQCVNGTNCSSANLCAAVLPTGSACDPTASLCDNRVGDTCVTTGSGSACTALNVVHIGAQCGVVAGAIQSCSAYALCSGGPPTVCTARAAAGAACTATPDNCDPGLLCTAATCQTPTPPVCP